MINIGKNRIFGLDLMRTVAISLVVFSHCVYFSSDINGIAFTLLNYAGLFGVEIFFVLSGFLIGRILYRKFVLEEFTRIELVNFWKRRGLRTLPNYYLILVINVILGYFIFKDLPSDLWTYFFFIQNFTSEQSSFFYESWSLSIEEFSYLIGPILLYLTVFLPIRISKQKIFLLVSLLIILLFIITKIQYQNSTSFNTMLEWTIQLKSVVIYRIDAVYYGFIAAYISIVYSNYWIRNRYNFLLLGIVLFIGFNLSISLFEVSNPLVWNIFYLPINSIAISLSLPFLSNVHLKKGITYKVVTFISHISYSIYLVHFTIVLKLMKLFLPSNLSVIELSITILIYLGITLSISHLLYRFFEKPLLGLRKKT